VNIWKNTRKTKRTYETGIIGGERMLLLFGGAFMTTLPTAALLAAERKGYVKNIIEIIQMW
jgi:hypothetical protein